METFQSARRLWSWRQWYFSILLLPLYLGTFLYWKWYPARVGFVVGGLVTASVMSLLMVFAARRHYFVNRVDLFLHGFVIVDLVLEAFLYELLRLGIALVGLLDSENIHAFDETVAGFHDNNNFYACGLFFAVVIGGYRWRGLWKRSVAREGE